MGIPSMIAVYFLLWVFSVFLVLPFGVKTADEMGIEKVPGQADSAPHEFRAGRTLLRVTAVATVMFALFLLNWEYGWIGPQAIDFFGGTETVK